MSLLMDSSRVRPLSYLLLLGAIGVIAANTWLAFDSVKVLEQSQKWVQHTYQVIAQVEIIMGSVKDAETGERGFLITADDQFLVPYTKAVNELPAEINLFQQLTYDNPNQQRSIEEMRTRMTRRLSLLQQGISMRRAGGSEDKVGLAVTGSGREEMDALRRLADRMEEEESNLLEQRQAVARHSSARARLTLGLASVLDLILLLVAFRFIVRERSMRIASELAGVKLAEARELAEVRAREVHALNATLEEKVRQRTSELETINRELEAFSYSVSHDLRAPLRTVDGFSLALEEDYAEAIDAVGKDYIRRVRGGVQRMGQLIDALLQLSRITRAELESEDFDLSALVSSIAASMGQEIADRQIEFRIEPGLRTNGDARLIRVALENLLGNAVKFSSKIASPVIEFGWDEEQKAYFVRDNGAGFDMEYADKLFNAFHRLHGDKDFKGSGIGLATVARVIRRHHGRIWAHGVVNHGATFWFTLQ